MPRPKRSDKFSNEREAICNKLIEIVGTEFLLDDLDNDEAKQAAIVALKDDIQKFFAVSRILTFTPGSTVVKRDYLNIVKAILKQQGYTFQRRECFKTFENGMLKRTTKYNIFRD
jgi:hypothetical protein